MDRHTSIIYIYHFTFINNGKISFTIYYPNEILINIYIYNFLEIFNQRKLIDIDRLTGIGRYYTHAHIYHRIIGFFPFGRINLPSSVNKSGLIFANYLLCFLFYLSAIQFCISNSFLLLIFIITCQTTQIEHKIKPPNNAFLKAILQPALKANKPPVAAPAVIWLNESSLFLILVRVQSTIENSPPQSAKLPPRMGARFFNSITPPQNFQLFGECHIPRIRQKAQPAIHPIENPLPKSSIILQGQGWSLLDIQILLLIPQQKTRIKISLIRKCKYKKQKNKSKNFYKTLLVLMILNKTTIPKIKKHPSLQKYKNLISLQIMILNTTIKRLFSKLINIHKYKPIEPAENNTQLSLNNKTPQYHQFNYTIKRLTTISQVFDTHRKHHRKLQPQQLSYIFYKIVQLWQINQSQIKSVEKLNQLCAEILMKIDKFPPEAMIKILHTCTGLNQQCIIVCLPLMNHIIDTLNDSNNIELVSQQQRIKLLFSLEKLVNRIGNRLTPNSIKLFRKIVGSISNAISTLKLSFQMQLIKRFHVRKLCSYNVAEKICKQLLKHQKNITTENLFIMHNKIIQHDELRKKLQNSIQQHRNLDFNVLNRVHKYILKRVNKNRQELGLLPSQLVIRYLEYLIQLPEKMKQIFQPEKNIFVVGFWLLRIANSAYSKHFLQNYKDNIQKKENKAWVRENPNFIVQWLQFISKLTNMHQNLQNEIRTFLNTLCQFYVQLKLREQIQLLKYLIQQKYSNSDSVADTLISQLNKKDIKFTVQDACAFAKILQYEQCTKKLNPSWLSALIKSIFDHSESIDNIGQLSTFLSAYTGLHINNLQIILKQYVKISLKNRCYANKSIQFLQAHSNKLSQHTKRIRSYRDDNGYLDQQYQIRQTILKKIQKSLNNIEIILLVLSKIASNKGHTLNIGQDQLCKELYQNWLEQLISFKFENLLTYEQIEKIYKLEETFKTKTNLECVELHRKKIQEKQTAK